MIGILRADLGNECDCCLLSAHYVARVGSLKKICRYRDIYPDFNHHKVLRKNWSQEPCA